MTKGKPWPPEDEKKLQDWVNSGIGVDVIAFSFDGKYTKEGIRQKMFALGLKEQQQPQSACCSSSNLNLPTELPSVEDALKTLSAALKALEQPGLDQAEVLRLRSIISGVKIYKELFADYVDYRGLEAEVVELRKKYAEEAAKKVSNVASS
jgi:hypothetical protein